MARPAPLSGFPERLPGERIVEEHITATVRRVFSLHGYAGIETRAVEPLDRLVAKGETSKEVYLLRRLHADETDTTDDRTLGLHFDLTVPLARYVVENAARLQFPFKRFQIQKAWRGERPQEGRYREFLQADIDVVGADELPFHYEVEAVLVAAHALNALTGDGLPAVRIGVNNRKVSQGFYEGVGVTDVEGTLRTIDKLDKIGDDGVRAMLTDQIGLTRSQAEAALELARISGSGAEVEARVRNLGVSHPLLEEGLGQLRALVDAAEAEVPGVVTADLRIARGLDYYTGTVYETVLVGHEDLGSICSGGRYDSLATDGRRTYPGVGLSIGVSRLTSRVLSAGLMHATRSVPAAVLVAVTDEDERARSNADAAGLRARGIPAEVAPSAAKFGKQIRYADRRGIPFVWFPAGTQRERAEVKDIRSGEQVAADAAAWTPPADDLWPRVLPGPAPA
ncbi:histidine--tRNA ligase [Pseudactinotalea sp. Z1732]|uniref:histidine--tRNA ligase n=1 Tax=Micrococcales TaxID=85006 RepID=UPI003C7C76DF